MKFTKENLASKICQLIEFDGDLRFYIREDIHFDGVSVLVEGKAFAHMNRYDECIFDFCHIDNIEVYHEEPSDDFVFTPDELTEIEKLVKLWM